MSRTSTLPYIMRRLLLVCMVVMPLFGLLARPPVVHAASHTLLVNSIEWYADVNPGDGICRTGENNCTLRAAMQEAHALGVASNGADTITINLERNTYPVQGTLYPGNATVIVNGNGSTLTGQFGGTVGAYRLFQNSSMTGHWYISDLTMTTSTGGGILVLGSGSLTVNTCTMENLSAQTTVGSTSGGAIASGSNMTLTVMGSTFRNNAANANGGAISHGHGALTISNSLFANNAATTGDGGGLHAVSSPGHAASLTNVNFRNNQALRGGGLFAHSVTLTMTGGEVRHNAAAQGAGIALENTRVGTSLTEVRIAENTATQAGGGLVIYSTALGTRVVRSTISGNSAPHGGGIMLDGARLDLEQSAVVGNRAVGTADTDGGGGIRVVASGATAPPLSVINSTISGNIAHRHGGGLYLGANTAAYLSSATVTANVSNESRNTGAGGGIVMYSGALASLGNTILAGNTMQPPSSPGPVIYTPDISGNLVSRGYNLIGIRNLFTSITGDTTGNRVGSIGAPEDAGLSPLGTGCSHDYIASVPTHPLLSTSMAINAANPTGVRHTRPGEDRLLTVDQCGSPRVQQGRADMGAAESPHVKYWPFAVLLPFALR